MPTDTKSSSTSNPLYCALINSYIDGRLTNKHKKELELKIAKNSELKEILEQRKNEVEDITELVFEKEIDINMLSHIKSEILEINNNVLEDKQVSILKSIWNWLVTPIKLKF